MKQNRGLFWLSFFIAAFATLLSWSVIENKAHLRICKLSMAAINSENVVIHTKQVTSGIFSRKIRIDYAISLPNLKEPINKYKYIICEFSAEQSRSGLSAIKTESGPFPSDKLYLLKRFYLESEELNSSTLQADTLSDVTKDGSFAASIIEWLLPLINKAALFALTGLLFCASAAMIRRLSLNLGIFASILPIFTSSATALLITGLHVRFAYIMAAFIGIAYSCCSQVLFNEVMKDRIGSIFSRLSAWVLFASLIVITVFWIPDQGLWERLWLPQTVFSSTPLVLLLVSAVIGFGFLTPHRWFQEPSGSQNIPQSGSSIFAIFALFIVFMSLAGAVAAISYLNFGMGTNPLTLSTKSLLILMLCSTTTKPPRQAILIVMASLTLVLFENTLEPYLSGMIINGTSYTILISALLIMTKKQRP